MILTQHGINSLLQKTPYVYLTDFSNSVELANYGVQDIPEKGPKWSIASAIKSTYNNKPVITLSNWNASQTDVYRWTPSSDPISNIDFEFNMRLLSCGNLEYFYIFFGDSWSKISFELGSLSGYYPKIVYYKDSILSYNTYGNISTITDTPTYKRIAFTSFSCNRNGPFLDIRVEFRAPLFTFYINGNRVFDAITSIESLRPRLVIDTQGSSGTSIQGQMSYIKIFEK